jgi:hypothetical protein
MSKNGARWEDRALENEGEIPVFLIPLGGFSRFLKQSQKNPKNLEKGLDIALHYMV